MNNPRNKQFEFKTASAMFGRPNQPVDKLVPRKFTFRHAEADPPVMTETFLA